MANDRVLEAIADFRRRGMASLDELIGILRRGQAAVAALALQADEPSFRQGLVSLVRANGPRFAVTVASLPKAVRRHHLLTELLNEVGAGTLAATALTAWDEGRRDDATFLGATAATLGPAGGELELLSARQAVAARDEGAAAEACARALAASLPPALVREAALILSTTGHRADALDALASLVSPETDECLAELLVTGYLGSDEMSAAWWADAPGERLATLQPLLIASSEAVGRRELDELDSGLISLHGLADELLVSLRELTLTVAEPEEENEPPTVALADRATTAAAEMAEIVTAGSRTQIAAGNDLQRACLTAADRLGDSRVGLAADLMQAASLFRSCCSAGSVPAGLRLVRSAAAIATACRDALAMLTEIPRPLEQRLSDLPLDLERELRSLQEEGTMVRGAVAAVPAVRCDRRRIRWSLSVLARELTQRAPTSQISIGAAFDASAGCVSLSLHAVSGAPDRAAGAGPCRFPLAVAERLIGEADGTMSLSPIADGLQTVVSLPVSAAEVELAALVALGNEARMALRAAEGMAADGNAEMTAYLAERAIVAEASVRLKPRLSRHLLLPRAVWALGQPSILRNGLPDEGRDLPQLAGRRVEEWCRAVSDDRLSKRLGSVRDYAEVLRIFALPHVGWPGAGGLPGLSVSVAAEVAESLQSAATALTAGAADALSASRAALARLLTIGRED
jgi:hypothetical protein